MSSEGGIGAMHETTLWPKGVLNRSNSSSHDELIEIRCRAIVFSRPGMCDVSRNSRLLIRKIEAKTTKEEEEAAEKKKEKKKKTQLTWRVKELVAKRERRRRKREREREGERKRCWIARRCLWENDDKRFLLPSLDLFFLTRKSESFTQLSNIDDEQLLGRRESSESIIDETRARISNASCSISATPSIDWKDMTIAS